MRGIVFSISVLLLFSILFSLALLGQNDFVRPAFQERFAAKKIAYSWDDVREDVLAAVKLNVSRNAANISFTDVLPADYNLSDSLAGYGLFATGVYPQPGANISFEYPLPQWQALFSVMPMRINYSYPRRIVSADPWEKNSLSMQCDTSAQNCDYVRTLALKLSINQTFRYDPTNAASQGNYSWVPAAGGCTIGSKSCIALSLNVTDRLGRSYACPNAGPGVTCSVNSFYWNNTARSIAIAINESASCNLSISVGNGLSALSLRDATAFTCGIINASTTLALNTSDYYLGFGPKLDASTPQFESDKNASLSAVERVS